MKDNKNMKENYNYSISKQTISNMKFGIWQKISLSKKKEIKKKWLI